MAWVLDAPPRSKAGIVPASTSPISTGSILPGPAYEPAKEPSAEPAKDK
jgi:hypothetical protein